MSEAFSGADLNHNDSLSLVECQELTANMLREELTLVYADLVDEHLTQRMQAHAKVNANEMDAAKVKAFKNPRYKLIKAFATHHKAIGGILFKKLDKNHDLNVTWDEFDHATASSDFWEKYGVSVFHYIFLYNFTYSFC